VIKLIIEWRYIVIGIPAAMMIITFGLIGGNFIKTTFFPRMEFDSFNINIAFTPGSGERQTMEYLNRFDSIVWVVNDELMEEYNDTLPIIENSIVLLLGSSFDGQESGTHAGSIDVSPRNSEETGISSYEIINRLRKKLVLFLKPKNSPLVQATVLVFRFQLGYNREILTELELAQEHLMHQTQ
jgi:multidrug efflux pump subunit AcrB